MFSSTDIEVPPPCQLAFFQEVDTMSMMPPGWVRRIDRKLIHPSDSWPLPGHPETMKKSYRRDYFHTSVPWPLLQGHPETMKMEPPPRLFSHQCLEGEFCELRHNGVLRSSRRIPE